MHLTARSTGIRSPQGITLSDSTHPYGPCRANMTKEDVMIKGFKEFIVRGNVVDLAVGIVIGAAFGTVVNSFVDDVLMAIVGAVFGEPNFNSMTLSLGSGTVFYGRFLTVLVTFVITAAAIYFAVVVPMNALAERRKRGQEDEVELTNEEKMVALLEEIAAGAKK